VGEEGVMKARSEYRGARRNAILRAWGYLLMVAGACIVMFFLPDDWHVYLALYAAFILILMGNSMVDRADALKRGDKLDAGVDGV
jgi:uncharacterized membrane protein YccC